MKIFLGTIFDIDGEANCSLFGARTLDDLLDQMGELVRKKYQAKKNQRDTFRLGRIFRSGRGFLAFAKIQEITL